MPKQENQPSPVPKAQNNTIEKLRINRAFQLAIFGLALAAVLVVALLVAGLKASADIVAIVGLFTSVLGTLVGAFFGLQIGSADKAKVEERADNVQKRANALQAAADDKTIQRAKREFPDLFK